jgi:hypothetical protein
MPSFPAGGRTMNPLTQFRKTTILPFVLVLGLLCFGFLPVVEAAVSPAPDAADANVRGTLQRLYTTWSDLDPAKAAPFYVKDADLVFYDIAPMKYSSWSDYAVGVPKAFAPYKSGRFRMTACACLFPAEVKFWDCGSGRDEEPSAGEMSSA